MNTIPAHLDHIVLATPDLAETVAEFARRTGVVPAPGGVHIGLGTRNYLVGLGDGAYLEILGPDPEQPALAGPRPFGVDGLDSARTITWAISPSDIDATVEAVRVHGYDPGDVREMSRRRPDGTLLEWRLTDGGTPHPSGVVPFLIDWGGTAHPSASDLPLTPLLELTATAPDPEEVRPVLNALGTDLVIGEGPAGFSFTLDTPNGPVTFT
ncbi:VOC family protein [Streptomyces sp. Amel2xC10]|uniref:VOC family protein n=1 Tax=Streptomyces sp. Amel2xC10 TaxID=1305826 RepID=UPI000A08E645|nr:VOC family protein [Streptomyces sp. Amel2xC10]SMF38697.1 Glyoxalase-like domain-containing protein [Streptomyces sp. Amel2xC10]